MRLIEGNPRIMVQLDCLDQAYKPMWPLDTFLELPLNQTLKSDHQEHDTKLVKNAHGFQIFELRFKSESSRYRANLDGP